MLSAIKPTNIIMIPKQNKPQIQDIQGYQPPYSEQYSLTQQIFDPFSSSPPNEFISKLKQRMSVYNLFKNEVNRKSE